MTNSDHAAEQATTENPFAPPSTGDKAFVTSGPEEGQDYTADRLRHLGREGNLRSVGTLMQIWGVLCLLATIRVFLTLLMEYEKPSGMESGNVLALWVNFVFALTGAVCALLGGGRLKRFLPTGRIYATIVLIFPFLSLQPVGILLSLICLYLVWSQPSGRVFQADYREQVIPATRQIQPKSGMIATLILIAVIAMLLFSLLGIPAHL